MAEEKITKLSEEDLDKVAGGFGIGCDRHKEAFYHIGDDGRYSVTEFEFDCDGKYYPRVMAQIVSGIKDPQYCFFLHTVSYYVDAEDWNARLETWQLQGYSVHKW